MAVCKKCGNKLGNTNICSSCGAKQSNRKMLLGISIIIIVIFVGVIIGISIKNTKQTIQNVEISNKKEQLEDNKIENFSTPLILSQEQKEMIENDIEEKHKILIPNSNDEQSRFEEILEKENEENDFNKELHEKLENRYLELFGDDIDDDNPFEDVTMGAPIMKESKGGLGLGANTTQSDKPAVDKAIRISFDYGSYLNSKNIYMANYLKGNQFIETSADIEYAEFYLALDDLLKSIPENKRNEVVFAVVGYADTSYMNGIPDKGIESQKFNIDLSLKRAEAVVNMLITEKNISPERILPPEGRGFANLIREKGNENHEKSRRVEVFCYAK